MNQYRLAAHFFRKERLKKLFEKGVHVHASSSSALSEPISSADPVVTPQDLVWSSVSQRAQAWWGDRLLAETSAAWRFDEPGQPPLLVFPPSDVRWSELQETGTDVSPVKGAIVRWSAHPTMSPTGSVEWSASDAQGSKGSADLAWSFPDPPDGMSRLKDGVAFDHDRVRVEVLDTMGSGDPRDVAPIRFPAWGDASDLVELLRVTPSGPATYTGKGHADERRPVVEGSQMLAQALVAAGQHAPGRRAVAANLVFTRTADSRKPVQLTLEELSGGRTFTALGVRITQDDRLCAAGTVLLDVKAPALVHHQVAAPPCAGPLDSVPCDMSVLGRAIRVADDAYSNDPDAPLGPPVIDAWVRFKDVDSDDSVLHAALMAQFTGHMSIAAALRPHADIGQAQAHRTISTGINAISLSLHADLRADQWMRYHHRSTFAGDGMTHSECQVFDETGTLLASFAVEGMVRGFAGGVHASDARTAL